MAKLRIMETRTRILRAAALAACCLALALVGAGCDDAADPAAPADLAPDAGALYTPATTDVELALDTFLDFRVAAPAGRHWRVRWQRGEEPEAGGERYRFFARGLGRELLTARIEDEDGRSWLRHWTVRIDPQGRPRAEFLPAGAAVDVYAGITNEFRVRTPWPIDAVSWHLDGAPAGTDTLLRLEPAASGRHELAAAVQIRDSTFTRGWTLNVRPFAEAAPPQVTGVALAPGNGLGFAVLSWDRSPEAVRPVAAYEVRYSWDGPPTAASWADDHDPGDYPWHPELERSQVLYTPENAGLEPDRQVWFGVRARNDLGQLSPPSEAAGLRLPGHWWVEGTVRAPDGTPLAGILVEDRNHRQVTSTGPDGSYRVGPYFELTPVVIEASTPVSAPAGASWHLARSDTLRATGTRRQDFILIPRVGSAPGCFVFGDHFLWYLRTMTLTRQANPRRPNVELYHWPEYPVPVHVPDWVSSRGVDYGAGVREAIGLWNAALGEPMLVEVDDPALARVSFRYDLANDINYGVVELAQPGDGELIIGDAPPEHARVRITPDLPGPDPCLEIAVHELGHVLGLHGHAFCNDVPYIMAVSSLGALSRGRENLIHIDEVRAVRIIRQLPGGWDMSLYPLEGP